LSATHISHLKKLHLLDLMVGFSRIQDLNEQSLIKKHKQGLLIELGMIQNIKLESIIALKPDVVLGYHFPGIENQLKNLSKNGTQMIYINEYLESSPLAYVEWIKLFGILFDKTEQAIAQFNKIKNQYVELSAKAIKQVKKPTVLVNIPYGSTWFVPAGDNFMAHLIRDAGGDYVFANTKGSFNLKLSLEAVIESGLEADFWINPGQHTHKTSLLKEDPRFALFKAYRTNRIFNNTKAVLEQRNNDYFSRGLSNPHDLLADLVQVLHPEILTNRKLEWFHALLD
ncbi:MAG: ABC transporter substrate-binding protein, partial [bacterium]|nr:ABC transporter substrate-binding protein [bacterium]